MRLDHLLSKEEEVRVGLLLICRRFLKETFDRGPRSSAEPSGIDRGYPFFKEELGIKISGGDALRGHTRSHPEHDG